MFYHKRNSTSQDNQAFQEDEETATEEPNSVPVLDADGKGRKSIVGSENDFTHYEGRGRKNFLGSENDFTHYDQPIYMKREASSISVLNSGAPDLLIEFDSLYSNALTNVHCWVEKSRWMIYEEDYDIDMRRFGNPHLSTISIKGLKSFKDLFKKGDSLFSGSFKNYVEILQAYSDSATNSNSFSHEELTDIRNALCLHCYHAGMHLTALGTEAPFIHFNEEKQLFEANENYHPPIGRKRNRSSIALNDNMLRVLSQKKLSDCLSSGTEGLKVQVGILESIRETHSLFIRLEQTIYEDGLMDTYCPLRFIFLIFGPKAREDELIEVGRVFSVMMSNREFRESVYLSESNLDVIQACKKFLECSALIHLNKRITIDTLANSFPQLRTYAHRITTEQHHKNMEKLHASKGIDGKLPNIRGSMNLEHGPHVKFKDKTSFSVENPGFKSAEKSTKISKVFKQFVPPFYQVFNDLKGMKTRYLSDFTDPFKAENAAIIFPGLVFAYFVVLSPAITFGALFNTQVTPKMTITMCLIASGSFQIIYALSNGQPMEIIGITPTVFVVEQVLSSLSISLNIQLEVMRFWIGIYLSSIGFVFSMFNGIVLIRHFRRSVEEVYNTYYTTIYILSALFTMFKALPYSATPLDFSINSTVYYNERIKFGYGGTTLFMAVIMLNFCLYLVRINRGIYLRHSLRNILGAFNVPLGIILIVALNLIFFPAYNMPTLNIPPSNVINTSIWVNLAPLDNIIMAPAPVHGFCICIGASLFIMLVIEGSTNTISVTKAERKFTKKSYYSINIMLITVIFPIISVFLGWPFFSGAVVRSNAHCLAMSKWSTNTVPGVPKKIIGACEQRISGLIVGTLVFLSVFLGSALRYIPMAAMYGMFLYMGIMGITDMVLWRRIVNLMQRRKHWNDHDYLKGIPTWHIRILVFIQIFFIIILSILYIISQFTVNVWTLFLFPLFVGMYAMIRGYLLPRWPRLNLYLSKMDKKHKVRLNDEEIIIKSVEVDVNDVNVIIDVNEVEDNLSTSSTESEEEIY